MSGGSSQFTLTLLVEVLNETADLYHSFDATEAVEFLCGCVLRTVEHDLPREIDYLGRHNEAVRRIMDTVEMPDRLAADFVMFVRQNSGTLSRKLREREFALLTDQGVEDLEAIVCDAFDEFEEVGRGRV